MSELDPANTGRPDNIELARRRIKTQRRARAARLAAMRAMIANARGRTDSQLQEIADDAAPPRRARGER